MYSSAIPFAASVSAQLAIITSRSTILNVSGPLSNRYAVKIMIQIWTKFYEKLYAAVA